MSRPILAIKTQAKTRAGSMAEAIARKIAAMSEDGLELVEFAFRVFRDATMPFEDRKWAMEWLAKYGAGLPTSKVEMSGSVAHEHRVRVNLEHYTDEELEAHERMRLAAQQRALAQAKDANPKVIDVVPTPDPS